MRTRGLVACALVCALVGGLAGTAAAKKKPPVKKKPAAANLAAFYDCAKYISADRYTTLAGGWGGTYTLGSHAQYGDRPSYGPGGDSVCSFKQSTGYGDATVLMYWGTKNAAFSYAGIKQTATIRGSQGCTARANLGNPPPADPRECGPVAIPGLGDQAFAVFDYIMVLRGPVSMMLSLPEMPNPTGNLEPPQNLLVSMATAIMSSIPLKPPA